MFQEILSLIAGSGRRPRRHDREICEMRRPAAAEVRLDLKAKRRVSALRGRASRHHFGCQPVGCDRISLWCASRRAEQRQETIEEAVVLDEIARHHRIGHGSGEQLVDEAMPHGIRPGRLGRSAQYLGERHAAGVVVVGVDRFSIGPAADKKVATGSEIHVDGGAIAI
jgi:hypothetical protein